MTAKVSTSTPHQSPIQWKKEKTASSKDASQSRMPCTMYNSTISHVLREQRPAPESFSRRDRPIDTGFKSRQEEAEIQIAARKRADTEQLFDTPPYGARQRVAINDKSRSIKGLPITRVGDLASDSYFCNADAGFASWQDRCRVIFFSEEPNNYPRPCKTYR